MVNRVKKKNTHTKKKKKKKKKNNTHKTNINTNSVYGTMKLPIYEQRRTVVERSEKNTTGGLKYHFKNMHFLQKSMSVGSPYQTQTQIMYI